MAMSEFTHEQPETLEHATIDLSWLTLEAALYVALALVGLFIRLFILDYTSLNSDEAQQAIAAWNFARGVPETFTGSPFLFTGNAILFTLFGATDAAARLLPALFGSGLILIPALFRRELGRTGALIASALLMISPSLVFFSRNTNGVIIAVTCALAAFGFGWRYLADRTPRALNLAAIFAALAFLSAREVWMVVIAIIVFAIIMRVRIQSTRDELRFAAILFALVFFGIGTTFLMHREGLGATFDLFGAWLGGLTPSFALFDPLRLLVVYEPIVLFFGAAAVIQIAFIVSSHEQAPLGMFALWGGIAFILYSIGGDKNPARVVALVVPLALMAGWYLGVWFDYAVEMTDRETILSQEAPLLLMALGIAAFLFILLAELATRGTVVAADVLASTIGVRNASGLIVALLFTLSLAALAFLTVTTVGWSRAKDVGFAIVLTIFAVWTIRQTAMLNFPEYPNFNEQEYLVTRSASANVRDLVIDLKDVSRWYANDSHTLNLVIDASLGPMIDWYARDLRNARFVARPTADSNVQAILLPINAPPPASNWMGQTYQLETARGAGASSLLRWLIFRDVGATDSVSAVLWIPVPQ